MEDQNRTTLILSAIALAVAIVVASTVTMPTAMSAPDSCTFRSCAGSRKASGKLALMSGYDSACRCEMLEAKHQSAAGNSSSPGRLIRSAQRTRTYLLAPSRAKRRHCAGVVPVLSMNMRRNAATD